MVISESPRKDREYRIRLVPLDCDNAEAGDRGTGLVGSTFDLHMGRWGSVVSVPCPTARFVFTGSWLAVLETERESRCIADMALSIGADATATIRATHADEEDGSDAIPIMLLLVATLQFAKGRGCRKVDVDYAVSAVIADAVLECIGLGSLLD